MSRLMEIPEKLATEDNECHENKEACNNYKEEFRVTIKNVQQTNNICITRPLAPSRPIANTICLSNEDLKHITHDHDCWKIFNVYFRRILVFGNLVLLNHFEKTERISYRFSIDDGTEEIIAMMNVKIQERKKESEKKGRLTLESNKLKRRQEIGINLQGSFLPPASEQCQSILKNISNLHQMIHNNLVEQKKSYRLGQLPQKGLALLRPYTHETTKEIHFAVLEISQDDDIERIWKRNLSKIYSNQYLKGHKRTANTF